MKYICKTCGYKYDENTKNKLFKDLNETFKCPLCGSSKEYFKEDNNKNIDNENIKYKVIKKNLDAVINYAMNGEKTEN